MSHYMTALAMQQRGLKPAAKIVLYWLADHHNSETDACFPSLKTLADECEMDKATVARHLKGLEELGLIFRDKRHRENGSQTSTSYILSMKQPVAKCDRGCRKTQQGPVANCDPHNLGRYNLGNEPVAPSALTRADQPAFDLGEEDQEPPKKVSRKKPARPMPEGWAPDQESAKRLIEKYNLTRKEIQDEFEAFAGHAESTDRRLANWDAGFRTWVGKSAREGRIGPDARARSYPGASRRGAGTSDAFLAVAEREYRRESLGDSGPAVSGRDDAPW